jgi:hypothetical protein
MKRVLSVVMIMLISVSAISIKTTAFASAIATTAITSLKTKNKTITVKWKKKTGITGYQIQYSTNSKFKKNKKSIKIKKAKTTSKKISNLKESKKYYFRIRTYKSSNKKTRYSKWSKVKSVKTQKEVHCTNNGNHSIKCGNIGRWFNSRDEVDNYWVQVDNNYAKQYLDGTITFEEYNKKSPYGYECWSCSYCGKWTGNFKYD